MYLKVGHKIASNINVSQSLGHKIASNINVSQSLGHKIASNINVSQVWEQPFSTYATKPLALHAREHSHRMQIGPITKVT